MAQPDPNAPGIRAWALGGAGVEELRIGYEGLIPDIELALGCQHRDAPDDGVEEWPARAYVIAHALDANMVATLIGGNMRLPDGNLYAGLFAEYGFEDSGWSGGWMLGGAVDWPRGWQVIAEYQVSVWQSEEQVFLFGLRRRF